MTDYRNLLADTIAQTRVLYGPDPADAILATRVPDLCPDCKDSWGDNPHLPYVEDCNHLNAPTISDLLRWGTKVAKTIDRPDRESAVELNGYLYGDTPDLLAALRTEAES